MELTKSTISKVTSVMSNRHRRHSRLRKLHLHPTVTQQCYHSSEKHIYTYLILKCFNNSNSYAATHINTYLRGLQIRKTDSMSIL